MSGDPEREVMADPRRRVSALVSREPGYSVAQKCLEVQAAAELADPSLHRGNQVTLHPDAWSWYVGAIGEREVGQLLSTLGPDWMIRHAVPIGAGTADVDHLVIGPGGVFALNTKRHEKAKIWVGDRVLRVNNQNQRYLDRSLAEARDASARLSRRVGFRVPVTPVLVFVGPDTLKDAREGDRTAPIVVVADHLVPWLRQQSNSGATQEQLDAVRAAADDPATWHIDPSAADTFRVMERFRRLVAAVGAPPPPPVTAQGKLVYPPARSSSSRPPRTTTRSPSQREMARRARRTEDLIKLVVLVIAGLSFPVWGPAFIAALTAAVTP
ncbi:nuclease-related domain-containing protein [Microcella sp.]|uniref:nuclease-related domain-containing protein n=1 Tax=Microcella sp. TaxID=1913979 RepID=UPI003F6F2681